jgi:multimeric flavodoxin WrbA
MNAVIINGSARGTRGITSRMLTSFGKGLQDAGCTVHSYNLNELNIDHCSSCFHCMHSKPGICSIRDDMAEIYDHLKISDVLVIGTPLYTGTMSSRMKIFFDRCISSMQPFIHEDIHGRFRHSFTWRMPKYFILISTSGFPETENFKALELTVKVQADDFGSEFMASLCVPGSLGLQMEISLLEPRLDLIFQAGVEFGNRKTISRELEERINTPILSKEEFYKLYLKYEEWCKNKLLKNS